MRKIISSLIAIAAASAFVFPAAFSEAVAGCSDNSYVYRTSMSGQVADAAAHMAKFGFCKVAAYGSEA